MENNRFENNVAATLGGGVFYQDIPVNPGSSLFLQNCEFRGNIAADGGGAYLRADDIDITAGANLFSDNTASNSGGGLYFRSQFPTVSVTGSTLSGNSAAVGGGLFCESNFGSAKIIVLSTILTGNSANTGAGIALGTGVKTATIRNCDIVANNGDALSWHSNLRGSIEKCIVAFNSGFAVRCTASASPILVSCSNFFSNSFDNAFTCATDGGQNISANPKFCTDTAVAPFSLAEDSPCAPANSPCG
ncbi:MAG: right-handed parallel beta-helix repeat-containing protein [Candidatus Krumholzibacteriota bacterium]|nr:right-handed parallel beta-helix repeat-containing protein [Candidatus Krumholzibacteriota bacterium]